MISSTQRRDLLKTGSPHGVMVHLVFLLLACCLLPATANAEPAGRNVLVLFSGDRQAAANVEIERGLRESLGDPIDREVDFFTEFLDEAVFAGDAYEQTVTTYLRDKYALRKPEVIVAGGRPALDFLLRHRAALFPDVPVVHVAVSRSAIATAQPLPANVVGMPVDDDFGGTIRQALQWHPAARRVVVVTGAGPADRQPATDARATIAGLDLHVPVEYLSGLSADATARRLRQLGADTVVFTPGYEQDGDGRMFRPRESTTLIAEASRAPVYAPYSALIGTGIVGGLMPSYLEMGRQAAKAIDGLLDGALPEALALPASVPVHLQVDWRQARKWGLPVDSLPADAIVHFRAPTFWDRYRDQALVLSGVGLLLAMLITAFLLEWRLRRRTIFALEESERRMNLAARAARLSMWIWDVGRDKIWPLAELREYVGPSKEKPVRFDRVLDTVHPADREGVDQAVRRAVAQDVEVDVEYRVLEPSGGVRWIAARGRAEAGSDHRMTGVALDITARKEAELQAEKDRAALTHMTRVSMMGQMSASIAHQLNQPLAAILGNAEAARKILRHDQPDLAEVREICEDIISEDRRAAEIIRRLGALFKHGEMHFTALSLNELVTETLDLVRTELNRRHIHAATELAPWLPLVEGGRVQLQQVLLNLILNAADAMNEVDTCRRRLSIRTECDDTHVRVHVVDRGTGIDVQDIRRVFEPFWSTKAGGTGMGLAICKSIITAHRGTLTAGNNPEGGATFVVTWPLRQSG
ncbi:sensor histidine kinase [Variovorax rhizosphaerae]|uniref:histidine kinase n=1 Tax=Variovorax rhizosphaerae TaxID=1836200 RepID=A0ABU8WL01_9BURK